MTYRLSLINPQESLHDVIVIVEQIFSDLKGEVGKNFRNDIYLSTHRGEKKFYTYNFGLYKTDKNSSDYNLIKERFADILTEDKVYEMKD
jgi:hypothetical protein